MAGLSSNVGKIKDPLGDLSIDNTEHIRVVSAGIRQQIPVWDRQADALRQISAELQNLTLRAPTGESFFDEFLTAHREMITRVGTLATQGQAAMRDITGLLAATADAYEKAEEYNTWLALQRLP
jgi:hypothetical protein